MLLAKYLTLGQALVTYKKSLVISIVIVGFFMLMVSEREFVLIFKTAAYVALPLILINHFWLYLDFGASALLSVVFMAYTISVYEGVPRTLDAISPDRHSVGSVMVDTMDHYTLNKLIEYEKKTEVEDEEEYQKKAMSAKKKGEPMPPRPQKKPPIQERFEGSKTIGMAMKRSVTPAEKVDFSFGYGGMMTAGFDTLEKVKALQANADKRVAFIDGLSTESMAQADNSAYEMSDPYANPNGDAAASPSATPASATQMASASSPPKARPRAAQDALPMFNEPSTVAKKAPVATGKPKGLFSTFTDILSGVQAEGKLAAPPAPENEPGEDVADAASDLEAPGEEAPKDMASLVDEHAIPFNLRGCDPGVKLDGNQVTEALKRMTPEERSRWSAARSQITVRSVMKLSMGTSAAFINDQLKVPGDTIVVNTNGIDCPYQVVSIQQYEVYFCPYGANGSPDRRKLVRLRL